MSHILRIGIISDDLGREAMGTTIVGRRLIEELSRTKEVSVTLLHRNPYPENLFSGIETIMVPTVRLPKWVGFFSYLKFFFTTKERFDVVHFLRPSLHIFFWILKVRRVARNIVVTFHGAPEEKRIPIYRTFHTVFMRWFIACFGQFFIDAAIAVSKGACRQIEHYYHLNPRKIHSIYNGVDARFRPLEDSERSAGEKLFAERYGIRTPYILTIARMDPHKNIHRLIEAFFSLKKRKNIPHTLVIVGKKHEPRYSNLVTSLVESSPLRDSVIIVPFVDGQDLPILYSLADGFAFVSLSEGFGLPLVEAMACGTPTLTSDASILPEIAGGAAILVDPWSEKAIEDGLDTLIFERDIRQNLRKKGIARAHAFTWKAMAEENILLYREVCR
jgi:glycosyltransferase involved in cell wall biosynthesis